MVVNWMLSFSVTRRLRKRYDSCQHLVYSLCLLNNHFKNVNCILPYFGGIQSPLQSPRLHRFCPCVLPQCHIKASLPSSPPPALAYIGFLSISWKNQILSHPRALGYALCQECPFPDPSQGQFSLTHNFSEKCLFLISY